TTSLSRPKGTTARLRARVLLIAPAVRPGADRDAQRSGDTLIAPHPRGGLRYSGSMVSASAEALSTPLPSRPAGWRLALALCVFGAVSTTGYWIVWFFLDRSLLANQTTELYFAYENAFPLADAWMAVASAAGAIGLWRRRPSALLWMLLGASASIYLGLLDLL